MHKIQDLDIIKHSRAGKIMPTPLTLQICNFIMFGLCHDRLSY